MSTPTSPLDDVRRALAEAVTFYSNLHIRGIIPIRYTVEGLHHLNALDTAIATLEQLRDETQHKEQQAS